jgi:hypothetical protein
MRMARLGSAALLALLASLATSQAEDDFVYEDSVHHFRIALPAGWKEIPRSVLDAAAGGQSNLPGVGPRYHAGLQLRDRDDFQYPRLLIQATPANPTGLAEVRQMLAEANRKANRSVTARQKEQGQGFRLGEPTLKAERQSIWFLTDTNVDQHGVPGVKGLVVLFAGQQQAIQVRCEVQAAEWEKFAPVFQSALESFRFEPGYERTQAGADWSEWVHTGLLVVLILCVVVVLWRRAKRRRQFGNG